MEVILLQKVANLGNIGDRVKVKSGYGRNSCCPRARPRWPRLPTSRASKRAAPSLKSTRPTELAGAQQRAEKLKDFKLTITAKAGTEGKLFGSVGTTDIAEAATKAGHALARSEVRLPTGPLRMVGEYAVELHLHADVNVALPVIIVAEE